MYVKRILILLIFLSTFYLIYCQEYWEVIFEDEDNIRCIERNYLGYLYVGTQNSLFISFDNGSTWINTNIQSYFSSILACGDTLYSITQNSIYISYDYGITWQNTSYPSSAISIYRDSYDNVFAGNWIEIYKSFDNCINWQIVFTDPHLGSVNDFQETPEGLFVATTDFTGGGGVYRSLDQGNNWDIVGLEYHFLSSLAVNSSNELFAGSNGHFSQSVGGVYRSVNNGETWETLTNQFYVNDMTIDSQNRVYIGCDSYNAKVWVSDDNGESWNQIDSQIMPDEAEIDYLTILNDNYLYAIGDIGVTNKIFRSVETTKIDNYNLPIEKINLSNFPNPFNPSTTIEFSIQNESNINLSIFNIKGQKIKTLANHEFSKGTHSIDWNGDDESGNPVSSGIYYYNLKVNGKTEEVKKCLLLK